MLENNWFLIFIRFDDFTDSSKKLDFFNSTSNEIISFIVHPYVSLISSMFELEDDIYDIQTTKHAFQQHCVERNIKARFQLMNK